MERIPKSTSSFFLFSFFFFSFLSFFLFSFLFLFFLFKSKHSILTFEETVTDMLYRNASRLLITLHVKATARWTPQVTTWLHALQDYVTSVVPSAHPDIDITLDVGFFTICPSLPLCVCFCLFLSRCLSLCCCLFAPPPPPPPFSLSVTVALFVCISLSLFVK